MRQYNGAKNADPRRWVVMDIECDAGCGVVPFRYRDTSYVHSLQWAIGLETFLLCEDPWRIFLTTDHPNGAPFYTYPHLIRLLMDRDFRRETMQRVNPESLKYSTLPNLQREYSLYEIAILTRAGPARSLGLKDLGHIGPGARADITVYKDNPNREAMFATPEYVFKHGELIVRDGKVVKVVNGATHVARPQYDKAIERPIKDYFDRYQTVRMENFRVSDDEIVDGGRGEIIVQPTKARVSS
jgi:formylmethanofuran dehydrogenase subunit A